jgi:hypothetical protein
VDVGVEKGGAEDLVFAVDDFCVVRSSDSFGYLLYHPIDDENIG